MSLSAAGSSRSSLLQSLAIQKRVIGALLMREVITRFGRENIGVLWLIVEPMTFTLGVTAFWTLTQRTHGLSLPIAAFAVTGYSSVLVWRNTVSHCNSAVQSNFNLLYHRNVRLLDVFVTRIILEIAGATGSFVILTLLFTAIEWIAPPVDLLMVVAGWVMLAWFGGALALLIGAATTYSELVDRIWHPTSYLLFPLSGAAFMVDWLPPAAREYALILPMVHGVEMVREGFFGTIVHTHYDAGYMASVNLVLTLTALLLLRDAATKVEKR
jgi:capsular polysaccharide transport system permease protein